ncbi:MAG: hypothetical protein LBT38_03695 [Deltaproteobacteria bacterium]|nr:hypothetical protein [Deltaproteobacteria bacterium]
MRASIEVGAQTANLNRGLSSGNNPLALVSMASDSSPSDSVISSLAGSSGLGEEFVPASYQADIDRVSTSGQDFSLSSDTGLNSNSNPNSVSNSGPAVSPASDTGSTSNSNPNSVSNSGPAVSPASDTGSTSNSNINQPAESTGLANNNPSDNNQSQDEDEDE